MSQKIQVGLVVVLLGGAGYMGYRWWTQPSAGTQDMSSRIAWICKNADCGKDFDITRKEYTKMRVPGTATVPCPHCDEIKTARAQKCPNPDCGRNNQTVGHDDTPSICEFCQKTMMGEQ